MNGYGIKHNHGSNLVDERVVDVIQYDSDFLIEDWDWGDVPPTSGNKVTYLIEHG